MSFPVVVADFALQSDFWNIEGTIIPSNTVSVLHPLIQSGLEPDHYLKVKDYHLYGVIRSSKPISILTTPTDPVLIVLVFPDLPVCDFYTMDCRVFENLKNYYIGLNNINRTNWSKEGF